ncbi:MAG TPA: site-2 protease family protein [Candidatus Saccharimonadia bacterium]|nr:site-2 protease family protein [Candidatus Saccharimonadia bacterium]
MLVIILIVFLFALLVILHEWGHFIVAKRGGVEVEEFGIGFPPKLWGRKVGGTLYSINLFPLGGFVRLKGEDAADIGPGTFGAARFGVKAKVLLAGVVMNLLTAIVILYGLCVTGLPALGPGFEPSFLHSTYAQPKQLLLAQVEAGSPAAKAGLKRGDYVFTADGMKMVTDQDLSNFTKEHAGQSVTFSVRSGASDSDMTIKLRGPNSQDGYLGVVSQQVYKLRYDPLSALVAAVYITGALFVATIVGVVELIVSIPALIVGLFSSAVPAAAQNASGPLGIIFILKSISSLGFAYIFVFMANIAVALAAFNVLPLPALDGGRLALIAFQRVFHRRISADSEAKIHAIGFMALIGLMCIITVYDLRKYF